MTSPLETKLLANLNGAPSSLERGLALAELGSYWARIGEFEKAEKARSLLRGEFGDGRSLQISVRLMVLEALQAYYRDLSPGARDRVFRASLLSRAANDRVLIALTSAWMAHIELNQWHFEQMFSELSTAIDAVNLQMPNQLDVVTCRIALTIGDASLIAGEAAISQEWYELARCEAVAVGDHAALGAMTYNRAALRVARARFEAVASLPSQIDPSLLRLDVESAVNYQQVAQLRSLNHLLGSARASLLVLQGRFAEAAITIQSVLESGEVSDPSVQRTILEADLALALARVEQHDVAIGAAQACELSFSNLKSVPTDDICLIASSMSQAAELLSNGDRSRYWAEVLSESIDRHNLCCASLREQLSKYSPAMLLHAADTPKTR